MQLTLLALLEHESICKPRWFLRSWEQKIWWAAGAALICSDPGPLHLSCLGTGHWLHLEPQESDPKQPEITNPAVSLARFGKIFIQYCCSFGMREVRLISNYSLFPEGKILHHLGFPQMTNSGRNWIAVIKLKKALCSMSLESLVIELALVETTQLHCSSPVLANLSLSLPHLQYSADKVPEHTHEKKLFIQNEKW